MRGSLSLFKFDRDSVQRHFLALITAAFFSVGLLSCAQNNSNQRAEDSLEKAYALIDNGREDEAIELLQSELQKGGLNSRREEEFKAALASAHVKRAGVPAQSFYDFARTWMDAEDQENFSFAPRDQEDDKKKDPKTDLEIFEVHGLETLAFFLQVKSRFDRLPELTPDQDREMEKAVGVLATLRDPSRGVALYRGLVRTVRFKYRLKNGLYFQPSTQSLAKISPPVAPPTSSVATSTEREPLSCIRGKTGYLLGLEELASEIELILGDLVIAFPSQNASIDDARKAVVHARSELARLRTETLSSASLGGFEWSEVVRFVRLQFGWEWSCK